MFPLSNWTELDIWQYTRAENIPVVPLYFAARGRWCSAMACSSCATMTACRCCPGR